MFWRLRMMEEKKTGAAAANVSANNPLVASTNWSSTRFFLSLDSFLLACCLSKYGNEPSENSYKHTPSSSMWFEQKFLLDGARYRPCVVLRTIFFFI